MPQLLALDLRYPTPDRKTFRPVGRCIYCGSCPEAGKLTREHIIAHGLTGTLILPEASCATCQKITGAIEGYYLQKMIRDARIHMKLASRRYRRNKSPPPALTIGRRGSDNVSRQVPMVREDHPYWLMTLGYAPPGILVGADENYAPSVEFQLIPGQDWPERWRKAGPNVEIEYHSDSNLFARLLAKTAHSFAVAALGIDGFVSTLTPIVLGISAGHAQYVGGLRKEDDDRRSRPETLHSISIERQADWFIVRLRLFAFLEGTPSYIIVAGHSVAR